MKNEIIKVKDINIENMIYEIDGVQVMLDSDLAKLYHVETKRINEAVFRNSKKFPKRFTWVLDDKSINKLWSQNATANISSMSRSNPRVFTEQGVYMLSTILKSDVATEVSIAIMDTFVNMRHYINYSKNILPLKFLLLEEKVDTNTKRISELFDKFDPKVIIKDYIIFEGEIYDAYSIFLKILNQSKKEIIIIDNYVDKNILDVLSKIDKDIVIITNKYNNSDYSKYKKQYKNIKLVINNSIHDRFIILDNKTLYHSGASFKDLGKKCFAISKIDDEKIIKSLLNDVNKM